MKTLQWRCHSVQATWEKFYQIQFTENRKILNFSPLAISVVLDVCIFIYKTICCFSKFTPGSTILLSSLLRLLLYLELYNRELYYRV